MRQHAMISTITTTVIAITTTVIAITGWNAQRQPNMFATHVPDTAAIMMRATTSTA